MKPDAPVGIIGLGLMGIAFSARLVGAKIPLIGFDIDPVRCGMFKSSGGMVATSVRELAARAQAIIVAVYSGEQAEVLFGTATALLGGDAAIIDSVGALLNILCPRSLRIGAIGDASRAKLAINLILQNNRAALAEGLAFAERLGLDGPAFLAAARQSAAYSRVMDTKGEKMLNRDFRPQSHISQTLRDAELILREAARRGLD